MGKVILWTGVTTLDTPPDRILEQALGELDKAVICGIDKNGELYFASSTSQLPDILWLLEKVKQDVMER